MWTPVVLSPPLTRRRRRRRRLRARGAHAGCPPSRRSTRSTAWSASSRTCAACASKPGGFGEADLQPRHGPAAARARLADHGRRARAARAADAPGALSDARFREASTCRTSPDASRRPGGLPRQRRGTTPQMHGRYPDYDVLEQRRPLGRADARGRARPGRGRARACRFFTPRGVRDAVRVLRRRARAGRRAADPGARASSTRSSPTGGWTASSYADMPDDRETWRLVARGLDEEAQRAELDASPPRRATTSSGDRRTRFADGELHGGAWDELQRRARVHASSCATFCAAFYSHPWAWNEIGFGGPAYPRGYVRLGSATRDGERRRWEAREAFELDPVARHAGARARLSGAKGSLRVPARQRLARSCSTPTGAACPNRDRMARYRDDDEVDLVDRRRRRRRRRRSRSGSRAGAGGSSCSSPGPFWDPDRDWVSDEAGASRLYWTDKRIIGGERPGRARQEQLRRTASAARWSTSPATRRASTPPTSRRARATASAPTGRSPTADLKAHYERVERELPVAGQDWPWGDPHGYPHAPHPICRRAPIAPGQGARKLRDRDARRPGRDHQRRLRQPPALHLPRLLPAGLQGQREGRPADHAPPRRDRARRRGPRRLPWSRGSRSTTTGPRARGVTYVRDGVERFQRAAAVAVCGYSIETPRLLLNSASARSPHGLGNDARPGRPLRDGAGRDAGRRRASPSCCACTRRRRRRSPPSSSTRPTSARVRARLLDPDGRAAADRLGRARARRRPLGPGAARVHARLQPLDGARRALRAAAAAGEPRHARRRDRRRTGCRSPASTTASATTTAPTSPTRSAILHEIWEAAGAQDTLTIDRYAHLVGGCRMGSAPSDSVVDARPPRLGHRRTCSSPTAACMPTQGAANPALTIMALADRAAGCSRRSAPDGRRRSRIPATSLSCCSASCFTSSGDSPARCSPNSTDAVTDSELGAALAHLDETRDHVDRIETRFRRLEVAPRARLLSQPSRARSSQHDELAPVSSSRGSPTSSTPRRRCTPSTGSSRRTDDPRARRRPRALGGCARRRASCTRPARQRDRAPRSRLALLGKCPRDAFRGQTKTHEGVNACPQLLQSA